jgi:hypothetical protein
MPHVHSMTIFDADRIEISWCADFNAYSIKLFEDGHDMPTTRINIWRNAEGGPRPVMKLEGITLATKEINDAFDEHNEESD